MFYDVIFTYMAKLGHQKPIVVAPDKMSQFVLGLSLELVNHSPAEGQQPISSVLTLVHTHTHRDRQIDRGRERF